VIEYPPGTVADISYGTDDYVRAMVVHDEYGDLIWMTTSSVTYELDTEGLAVRLVGLADIAPHIVSKLDEKITPLLRGWTYAVDWTCLVEQLKASTSPPRPQEPGLYGVVRATGPGGLLSIWFRDGIGEASQVLKGDEQLRWSRNGARVRWDELSNIEILREGIEPSE